MATSTILKFFMGRRGDVISRLPSGKIVLPARGWKPRAGEEWEVELVERERVAIAHPLHRIVEKERPVLRKFKCGHTVPAWTEKVRVPENTIPEPRILDFIEPSLCPKCKEHCKHKHVEFARSSFWVAVNCKDCKETVWSMDINEPTDADKAVSEIRQRFPQLSEVAEKSLEEWKGWKAEFTMKSRAHREIVNRISELKREIIELSGRKGDPEFEASFRVNPEKQRFEWTVVVKEAPNEVSTAMTWAPLPEEHRDEILQMWEEVEELNRKESVLHRWLVENRPVE
ncbi:MAG: hypothetical protein ACXQS2_02680 [Methermicoccaceae archaeon]